LSFVFILGHCPAILVKEVRFANMFGLLIPGRPMMGEFRQVSPQKVVIDVVAPAFVREFCVTILNPALPVDHGVAVYYALAPFQEWSYVGQLSLNEPTNIFRAPWYGKIAPDVVGLQIGLSVETTAFLNNLRPVEMKQEEKTLEMASGIAKDLFQFMASFSQTTGQYQQLGDVLVIPTNCIDKWFEKFLTKHRMEPYFWMKPKG